MSPRSRRSSTARHHVEWLQLVDVSGPFIGLGVLAEVFPQGLDAVEPALAGRLKQAHVEWQANRDQRRSDAAVDTAFVDFVLGEVLEYPSQLTATGAEIGDAFSATLPEHRVTLRPDRALRRPGEPPKLLLSIHPPGVAVGKPFNERGLHASPSERMRLLLSRTSVRSGLVTNGREWTLVHASVGRTASFVTWYADLLVEERVTLRAFRSLLGVRRLFGVDDPETLDGLFERSSDDEREVTDQLGRQARQAVELLVAAFDRADRDTSGALLEGIPESRLYEATIAIAMRIIFLLAAEARGLFPDDGPWAESYALTPLRGELQAQADRHGIEVLERRVDAWSRLLATFQAVHGGVEHSRVRMPGYGGGLFDPSRYSFLEDGAGAVPRISNRAVLHVLDALQTLEVEVPGGRERRPLSFRALGIEQIGHVYEGLLDHTAVRAPTAALGLTGTKKKEPELALELLEKTPAKGDDALLELLKEQTGRSIPALRKVLKKEPPTDRAARLRVACGHDAELAERVTPFLGLVRDDVFGDPMVFPEGHVYVTQSPFRRSTGTHYTPPGLTEPIVQYALEPIAYHGPSEGTPREQWELKRPSELLALKVCDIAMGSAAFLVAACRYLAARLVEAWELHPDETPTDAGTDLEERELTARRLVAERCLYGVDVNPLAVDIAKVSLWLVTLRRDRPFTFLDHALRCGDSLLGVVDVDSLESLSLHPAAPLVDDTARAHVHQALAEAQAIRQQIGATDPVDLRQVQEKATALAQAEHLTGALRTVGDLVIGAALKDAAEQGSGRTLVEASAAEIGQALAAATDKERKEQLVQTETRALDALMTGRPPGAPDPPQPFHWALEFSEVFQRKNGGFDAIVGNPPFLGGKKISNALGGPYRNYLVEVLANGRRGNADLVAFFFLRSTSLLRRGGCFGLVATNTIAQGDTREVGLDQILSGGSVLVRAVKSQEWPGEAGVYVGHVWALKGTWNGISVLDGSDVVRITSRLQASGRVAGDPHSLATYADQVSVGCYINGDFDMDPTVAAAMITTDPKNRSVLLPYLVGQDLTTRVDQTAARWVVDFSDLSLEEAARFEVPFHYVRDNVRPHRQTLIRKPRVRELWWQHEARQEGMRNAVSGRQRVLVGPQTSKWWFVAWVPGDWLYSRMTTVFMFEDDGHAAVLSSSLHDAWARKYSGSLKFDLRYSPTDCFRNFPFPSDVSKLDEIGDRYLSFRKGTLLAEGQGLTDVYNRVHERPDERSERIGELRRLRRELDRAVAAAYGWSDLELDHDFRESPLGPRYTISDGVKTEALDRLLELNHCRYAEENASGLHAKGKKTGGARKGRSSVEQLEL